MEGLDNPIYSKNSIEFVTVANEFCKFIENSANISLTEFVDTTHRLLPFVYLKGSLLPKIEESFSDFNEKYVSESDYNYIQDTIVDKFGKHNFFEEIFDPLRQENDEPVQLSIGECFADIYQDLKDFIMQFQTASDEIMTNAIWECQQAFEQYWGQRTVNLLRVLHNLKYFVVDLEEENSSKDNLIDSSKIDTKNWPISRMQEDFNNEE
jgi:hypothetical protein